MKDTFPVALGISAIDTVMTGRHLVTSAYLVSGEEPALVETGPATSSAAVVSGLDALGVGPNDLAHIVVTHIHLDHAGGVGTLSRIFPKATVWVHDRGAPHLADPTKLVSSTSRVYGVERMRALFGEVEPVAAGRLRSLADGDEIALGPRALRAVYTPGHASHHLCLIDSDTGAVFTGDALGVHLPDVRVLRPATPPPDFDVELAVASIEWIRRSARGSLLLSHFGPIDEVDHICELASRRIVGWSDEVRRALETTDDIDEITVLLERRGAKEYTEDSGEEIDLGRYDVLSSVRMNAMGLARYWRKLAEREGEASDSAKAQPS